MTMKQLTLRVLILALGTVLGGISLATAALPEAFWPTQPGSFQTAEFNTPMDRTVRITGQFHAYTGKPIRVTGGFTETGFTHLPTVDELYQIVDENTEFFVLPTSELDVLHSGTVMGKSVLTARQNVDDRPVLDTHILLRVAQNGRVPLWGADIVEDRDATWNAYLTSGSAARELAHFAGLPAYETRAVKELWVRENEGLSPAYQVQLSGTDPHDRPLGLVHAQTGEILGFYNEAVHADVEGTAHGTMLPHTINDDEEVRPLAHMRATLDGDQEITDADGDFLYSGLVEGQDYDFTMELNGPWITVINDDGDEGLYEETITASHVFDPTWLPGEHARLDEINAFYHGNFIHDWYKELDPDFDGLDYSVPTTVGYGNSYDNAFWNGYGMFYGSGGTNLTNLALSAPVIYHEYTHGVTGHIYPGGTLPYSGQSGAMNEAWSDYFPCSIFNTSGMGIGTMQGAPNAPMRDLDNEKRYPEDWHGQVHA
ncbi:hypothetical protein GF324_04235, partial [bacterium]|nr:hypothetical protein [bacterium]